MKEHLTDLAGHTISRHTLLATTGAMAGGLVATGALDRTGISTARAGSLNAMSLTGKKVGIASPVDVEVLNYTYKYIKLEAAAPGNGESIVVVDANGNSITQHAQVETFIAQKYAGLIFFVLQATGWEDAVKRATAQGGVCFNHSASAITGMTQNVVLNQYSAGYAVGTAAAKWIAQNKGGKAQVALLEILNDPQLMQRGQGFEAALKALSPGSKIVTKAAAQTAVQATPVVSALLQAHPDVSVVLSAGDDPGIATYSAFMESSRTDPKKYYIGSCDGTALVVDHVAKGTVYQATWDFVFSYSAVQMERDIETTLRGGSVPPTRIEKGLLVTPANANQFHQIADFPLSAANQHYYKTFMQYSNTKLMTGQGSQNAK